LKLSSTDPKGKFGGGQISKKVWWFKNELCFQPRRGNIKSKSFKW